MAAFDVTTRPTSLTLRPGSTGTIIVVVSNRLGRPVMGLVEGSLNPASAASWLVSPPDLQRRYEADPAATVSYEFKVAVPADAPAQAAQFKASVRDVMAPDDTRAEGQTVAINVTPDAAPPPAKKKRLPLWVWLIAGLVLAGAAIVIWLAVRPEKMLVPDVLGKSPSEANEILTGAGFDSVLLKDTVAGPDTNKVIRQDPEAGGEMPKKNGQLVATIVVNQPAPGVPNVIGKNSDEARRMLRQAGFAPVNMEEMLVQKAGGDTNIVVSQHPRAGAPLPRDTMIGETPATIVVRWGATEVPKMVGLVESTARHLIQKAGLQVGTVTRTPKSVFVPHGMVLDISPAAGKVVRLGSAVKLKIAN